MTDLSSTFINSIEKDTKNYIDWLKNFEFSANEREYFCGPIVSPEYPVFARSHDNVHYPLGMRKLLKNGFFGIKKSALNNSKNFEGNRKDYLLQIHNVYNEITELLMRFAKEAQDKNHNEISNVLKQLSNNPPETFREACQTYWLSMVLRIGTSAIGRIDQHLYPFYKRDIDLKRITPKIAKTMIDELLNKFENRGHFKGDTLQNITLSGLDENKVDQTNDLTYLFLQSFVDHKYIEPKINVRLNKNSPEKLLDYVTQIQYTGTGLCTIFNDDSIIEGLQEVGRPIDVATDYCADGCTEIILDGHGSTWFRYIDCVKAIEHTLFSGSENVPEKKSLKYYSEYQDDVDLVCPVSIGLKTKNFLDIDSYEEFYSEYLKQIQYQVKEMLKGPFDSDENPMRIFTAATMPSVIEKAQDPYTSSDCYHTYGLFIGSLGTAANSLAAIKSLVFEQGGINKEDLLNAVKENFEGHSEIRQMCKQAPKFGNDDDYVDSIAIDVADHFKSMVSEYRDRSGKPILPGLYNHLFHHTAYRVGATPDGRKFGDSVGEHFSPSPGTAMKGPTAIINSLTKLKTNKFIFASTLHLNIPKMTLEGENPELILNALNKVFCLKQGCTMNTNVLDITQLREAQKSPEKFQDLVVRVWGFSYYFVKLSKEMQDHVITRAQI